MLKSQKVEIKISVSHSSPINSPYSTRDFIDVRTFSISFFDSTGSFSWDESFFFFEMLINDKPSRFSLSLDAQLELNEQPFFIHMNKLSNPRNASWFISGFKLRKKTFLSFSYQITELCWYPRTSLANMKLENGFSIFDWCVSEPWWCAQWGMLWKNLKIS